MKQSVTILLLFLCATTIAQPDTVSVTFNKTTSLVFPLMIQNVDRGSKDLLVQKVKGAENVLLLKAGKENLEETNMTVITADGKLYSFLVHYADHPSVHVQLENKPSVFETVAAQKRSVHGIRNKKYQMLLQLTGLYIQNNVLYYQLTLQNKSNISYDIDILRFFVKDKKQGKRTASQELEQFPLQVYGNTGSVPGYAKQTIVVALSKFTIPDKKLLCVQVMEKGGGRNLILRIHNRNIIKAKAVQGWNNK